MKYLVMSLMAMLGSVYLVCSLAEFLLWLFERKSSTESGPDDARMSEQESRNLTALVAENPGPVPQPALLPQKPGILIADDHHRYRKLLSTWFREHGFLVWAAADGHEAVELYRAHAEAIVLALLDVDMPRLDGPQTLVVLRQATPSLLCCFMTATLTRGQEPLLLAQGVACVFEKPLLLREATEVISGLINKAKRRPGAFGQVLEDQ